MPISDLHKKKFKKNILVFVIVLFFIALIWIISMVRIGQGVANAAPISFAPAVNPALHNVMGCDANPFVAGREAHLATMAQNPKRWDQDYRSRENQRAEVRRSMDEENKAHLAHIQASQDKWDADYRSRAANREVIQMRMEQNGQAHLATMDSNPERWWNEGYRTKCSEHVKN